MLYCLIGMLNLFQGPAFMTLLASLFPLLLSRKGGLLLVTITRWWLAAVPAIAVYTSFQLCHLGF